MKFWKISDKILTKCKKNYDKNLCYNFVYKFCGVFLFGDLKNGAFLLLDGCKKIYDFRDILIDDLNCSFASFSAHYFTTPKEKKLK